MVKGKTNPVAKFSKQFNKGGPMRDRKKDDKRGYEKHKKQYKEDDQQTDTTGHTNSAAKRPQNYVDPKTGKTKVRMVSVHRDVQNEKLDPSMGVKKYIDDFQKSDAPQFQGKSKEKRKEMAIAAYLDAKRGTKKEACWKGYRQAGMKKKGDKVVPNCVPESTDAYGKSQAAIRLKKQKAAMSPSDRDKMSRVADMMRREREKRVAQKENYRASRAQSNAANKMYGRTSDPIDKKPASGAKKPISTHDLFKAIHKKYGSVKKEDAEKKARLTLKHTREKEALATKHKREKDAMREALSPTDQAKLRNLKRRVKQGDKTAKKQLDAFQKSKAKDIAMSKSSASRIAPSTRAARDAARDGAFKGGARLTSPSIPPKSGSGGDNSHIVMQLRKAQDVGGNMDLKVSPTGKKVRLSKGQIDSLLKRHDSMSKPRDKRMFRVQLTRKLRGMAK